MKCGVIWRRLILINSHISSFLLENRRHFFLKNSNRHKSSLFIMTIYLSSGKTIFVKIRQESSCLLTSNDVIRVKKNYNSLIRMINIIRRHSTFVKWLNWSQIFVTLPVLYILFWVNAWLGMFNFGDQLVDCNFFDSRLSRKSTSWAYINF